MGIVHLVLVYMFLSICRSFHTTAPAYRTAMSHRRYLSSVQVAQPELVLPVIPNITAAASRRSGKSSITSGTPKEQAAQFSTVQVTQSADVVVPVIPVTTTTVKKKAVPASNNFAVKGNLKTESEVSFIVYGEPTPLQRHRVLRSGISYNPSSHLQKGFLDACRNMLPDVPFEGPLEVKLYFHFKRPLNHYGSGKKSQVLKDGMDIWHSKKKDVDNLAKFVLDAINKVAYGDDGQVALLTTAKLYTEGEARVEVSIRKLADHEAVLVE